MIKYTVFAAFLALCWGSPHKLGLGKLSDEIMGGTGADITAYPYNVEIVENNEHYCGAAIIAPNVAITAAHCVYTIKNHDFDVRSGSSTMLAGASHKKVDVLWHPLFNPPSIAYDVGLVFVDPPFHYDNSTQPIKITMKEPVMGNITLTGWGFSTVDDPDHAEFLQRVDLPSMPREACDAKERNLLFCASREGKDITLGDNGGPVVQNKELVGVVAWTFTRGEEFIRYYANLGTTEALPFVPGDISTVIFDNYSTTDSCKVPILSVAVLSRRAKAQLLFNIAVTSREGVGIADKRNR